MITKPDLTNLVELYSSIAIYNPIDLSTFEDDEILSIIRKIKSPEESIDVFCVECKRQSTFTPFPLQVRPYGQEKEEWISDAFFGVELRCARNSDHHITLFFYYEPNKLIKIGQFPSLADLGISDKEKYRKILGYEKYRELVKAIGLKAHGVGVGSFVYLRRIFEFLIEQAYQKARVEEFWNENEYHQSRMDIKISILKAYLPNFLVENRSLYSILSKGIHSLGEDECLEYFDVILAGIEMILEEKFEELQKEIKIRDAQKAISDLKAKLKQ